MKRKFSLILALLMAASATFSCGSDEAGSDTAADTSADTTESITETTKITAEIPDKTYGGYEFRILGRPMQANYLPADEIYSEEQTGDILNDAVFERNGMVEDKLEVKIKKVEVTSPKDELAKAVMSDDDSFDAVVGVVSSFGSAITSGYLLEVGEMEYLDITKPWWKGDVVKDFAIAEKSYLLFGDIIWNDKERTWVLCFNKDLAAEYKLEDPYSLVKDGKWTLAKLGEQCRDISDDLNGDTVMNKDDQWGLLGSNSVGIGFITSGGVKIAESTAKGLTFTLDSDRSIGALDAIYDFIHSDNVMLRAEEITGVSNIWDEIIGIFREGRALYRISVMADISTLRDMEDDFGILPMPKLDDAQDRYYTTYQAWTAHGLAVPVTIKDPERTGVILEYMASVSTDTMLKAYYDTTLQRKVARDDESSEMLDIIFDSITTDVALALELGGIRGSLVNMINAASNTNASSIASIKTSVQTQLDTVYKSVSELE